MEKLITNDIAEQIKELFADMVGGVRIMFFTKSEACEYCDEIEQLVGEVSELSDLISLGVHDLSESGDLAEQYGVLEAPTLVILQKDGENLRDFGVRLLGAPAGHEFTTLIHDILYVSKGSTDLTDEARKYLADLKEPLLLQVFVTPTCPYCPQAVVLAHQMAMESPMIQAEMVEATEFPELASRHGVSGVPQTTINDGKAHVVGAVPESNMLAEIQRVLAG